MGPPLGRGLANVRKICGLCVTVAVTIITITVPSAITIALAVGGRGWIRGGGEGGCETRLWGLGRDIRKSAVRLRGVAGLGVRFGGLSFEYGHGAFERFPGDLHPDSGQSF
ncbi:MULTISPECIES: hypothetical protein [Streptomyces]|uniref:Uncharacterized protein n=1 Tax=Streptomyces siderophoricus TaxID=2802281 RepID=A0ABS1MUQ9_9ACTN|nr:hypothetical protein [Streptomyces sp. 9-7]MBL1091519.1 hypothetical protein [Streptomyces sp. 9-7]